MTELSTDAFQAAVARFPSGVAVVTVDSDDGPVSLAIRAFSAVSSDPPLVMVCIPRSAGSFKDFQWAQAFGVSILAITQVELARQFATGGAGDFRSVRLVNGPSATVGLIEGAVAHLECVTYDRHAAGDHLIMVGEVVSAAMFPGTSLVQCDGQFGEFQPLAGE